VIVLLSAAGSGGTATSTLFAEVLGGIAKGVAVPAAAIWLERLRFFAASAAYQPLNAVAVGSSCSPPRRSPTPTRSSRRSPPASPSPP